MNHAFIKEMKIATKIVSAITEDSVKNFAPVIKRLVKSVFKGAIAKDNARLTNVTVKYKAENAM
jgi:hypothetical protein